MKRNVSVIAIHLCLCISLLVLPYLFTPADQISWQYIRGNPHELSKLFAYLVMLGCFYINYYLLIPRLFFSKKYVLYILTLLAGFFMLVLVSTHINWHNAPFYQSQTYLSQQEQGPPPAASPKLQKHMAKPPIGMEFSHAFFLFLVGIFFTLMLRIYQQKESIAKERTDAELLFLKVQLNPHFLFNALNTIYSLTIREKAYQSSHTITQLSGMMRYMLAEANQQQVSLPKELDYLDRYIELQKIRFGETVQVEIQTEGDATGKQIAPLVLITFIENAFKHGVNPEITSCIQILIRIKATELHLSVTNSKTASAYSEAESTGTGILTTRKRLDLLYPGRHTLTLTETDTMFTVNLQMPVS